MPVYFLWGQVSKINADTHFIFHQGLRFSYCDYYTERLRGDVVVALCQWFRKCSILVKKCEIVFDKCSVRKLFQL